MDKSVKYIIGIDEVGRGPIAGPVAVCAFLHHVDKFGEMIEKIKNEFKLPLRDSKKLTKKQREKWFEVLKEEKEKNNCDFFVSFVSSENIDKFGISKCIQKALDEALKKVINKIASQDSQNYHRFTPEGPYTSDNFENPALLTAINIFLDGGLRAPKEYIHQETIIKGDELHPIISCASIVAKVSRDKVMEGFAKKYPEYGFDNHAGYGTKAHYDAIKKHGQISIHRKTFIH